MSGVSPETIAARLEALCPGTDPVLLALSGGGDSHALLIAAAPWAKARGRVLHAAIIDHGLRTGSAAEAEAARAAAMAQGVEALVLRWEGDKPSTGIQAAARSARHRLLAGAAREAGARDILFAHTADDQAETVWMRLLAGAGPRGLMAMSEADPCPLWPQGAGLRHVRPLLGLRRADLRLWLRRTGQSWIEDPANADRRHARVRARQRLAALETAGFDPLRLVALAADLRRLDRAEAEAAAHLFLAAASMQPWGGVRLDASLLAAAPRPRALRTLEATACAAAGASGPLRGGAVERLLDALIAGQPATGGGARLVHWRGAAFLVRDAGAVFGRADSAASDVMPVLDGPGVWDGRFRVGPLPPGARVEPLGAAPRDDRLVAALDGIPGAARPTLCALRQGGAILAVAGMCGDPSSFRGGMGMERAQRSLFAGDPPAWFYGTGAVHAGAGSHLRRASPI